jgi:hypothetical protein
MRWRLVGIGLLTAACGGGDTGAEAGTGAAGGAPAPDEPMCEGRPEYRSAVTVRTFRWGGFALLTDGTVWCWGDSPTASCLGGERDDGRRGGPPHRLHVPCARLMDASADYAAVVTVDDEVWMWVSPARGFQSSRTAPASPGSTSVSMSPCGVARTRRCGGETSPGSTASRQSPRLSRFQTLTGSSSAQVTSVSWPRATCSASVATIRDSSAMERSRLPGPDW